MPPHHYACVYVCVRMRACVRVRVCVCVCACAATVIWYIQDGYYCQVCDLAIPFCVRPVKKVFNFFSNE